MKKKTTSSSAHGTSYNGVLVLFRRFFWRCFDGGWFSNSISVRLEMGVKGKEKCEAKHNVKDVAAE